MRPYKNDRRKITWVILVFLLFRTSRKKNKFSWQSTMFVITPSPRDDDINSTHRLLHPSPSPPLARNSSKKRFPRWRHNAPPPSSPITPPVTIRIRDRAPWWQAYIPTTIHNSRLSPVTPTQFTARTSFLRDGS